MVDMQHDAMVTSLKSLKLFGMAQAVAELAMGDKRGAVVALNPANGEVLAMASRPTFDPNKSGGLTGQAVNVASNFSNIGDQTVNITGAAYNYASAAAVGSVSIGNQHVGGAATKASPAPGTAATKSPAPVQSDPALAQLMQEQAKLKETKANP